MPHEVLTFGDARVDFMCMEAQRAGKTVILTTQEFNLLRYMAASAERVVSRHELLNDVWGYENYPSTRTVDNYILRLRRKFEPDPSTPLFLSPFTVLATNSFLLAQRLVQIRRLFGSPPMTTY